MNEKIIKAKKERMKPIFYRCKANGECYKFVLEENVQQKDIDCCLDAIGYKEAEFITKEEFEKQYDKLMDIDVLDTTKSFKIGVLTTRWLDLENQEYI